MATKLSAQPKIAVIFPESLGAHHHPAFDKAIEMEEGGFILFYPTHLGWVLKSESAQMRWASDKLNHLRSWPGGNGSLMVTSKSSAFKYWKPVPYIK